MLWQGQSQVKAKDNTVVLCHRGLNTLGATAWFLLCKLLMMATVSRTPTFEPIANYTSWSARVTRQCARLANLLPSSVKKIGTAAEVGYALAEWLCSPILRPEEAAQRILFYTVVPGWERMGVALDRALSKIPDDNG